MKQTLKLTPDQFLKLINRYAYETKENNYNRISYKDYKKWYNAVVKFVNWEPSI